MSIVCDRTVGEEPCHAPKDRIARLQMETTLAVLGDDRRSNEFSHRFSRISIGQEQVNPYDPPPAHPGNPDARESPSVVVPYRLDWLSFGAIAASAVDAVAVWTFYSNGTGSIGYPVLARLAAISLIWIPVCRLLGPLLIPMTPSTCKKPICVFYISLGVLLSINNFSGHFLGFFVFDATVGLPQVGAACVIFGLITFCIQRPQHGNRPRAVGHAVFWIAGLILIECAFYLIGIVI